MKFFYKERMWDTDKYVYVAGYKILKSWFPATKYSSGKEISRITEYGLSCKRAYISSIYFDFNNGISFVKDFDICIPSETGRDNFKFSSLNFVDISTAAIKKRLR